MLNPSSILSFRQSAITSARIPSNYLNKYGAVYIARHDVSFLSDDQKKELPPVVYDKLSAIKIGYCQPGTNPNTRRANLQTGNPFIIKIEAFPCKNPLLMEKYFHNKYAEHRIRVPGEWFRGGDWEDGFIYEMKGFQKYGVVSNMQLLEELKSGRAKRPVPPEIDTIPTIDGGVFKRKNDLKEECCRILERHTTLLMKQHDLSWLDLKAGKREESYLEIDECEVVFEALQTHPEATKKIGVGVNQIFVAKTLFGSYCFHVIRTDGSEEDFNYRACFSGYEDGGEWYTFKLPPQ